MFSNLQARKLYYKHSFRANTIMAGKSLSFFNKAILVLNIIAAVLMLLCHLAPYISPVDMWMFGLMSLAYPFVLLLNIFFTIYWLVQFKKLFLISLVVTVIGFNNFNNTIQFHINPVASASKSKKIKLMSYNVRLFDLYNWSKSKDTREKMFKLIKKESPDILCVQEFYNSNHGEFDNLDTIVKNQRTKFSHVAYTENLHNNEDHWGMATFSTYPIINKGIIDFNEDTNNSCIYSDINTGEDTVRVYNLHLQSIRFGPEDYEFVENISKQKDQEEIKGSKKILKRLKIAFIKRAKQVDLVSNHIKKSPYPVIICGDFNDTPSSYTYHKIKADLKDAFVGNGFGIGNTYNGVFPSFRIDYILYDGNYTACNYRSVKKKLSDHYPVTCTINLD
jgi:endonuclease/exonuclease/phosphatase family metal-dependent hydrolase